MFFSLCLANSHVYLTLYFSADARSLFPNATNDQHTQASKDQILSLIVGTELKNVFTKKNTWAILISDRLENHCLIFFHVKQIYCTSSYLLHFTWSICLCSSCWIPIKYFKIQPSNLPPTEAADSILSCIYIISFNL